MSDPRYHDGDVVWCKCGGLFWPGEVKGLASLPEEIREGFLRTPLVVVKFFDEDGYEFVLNENNIFPYNCPKKTDFIQKGIARFRSKTKEGATEGWYAKFPKDVVHCEILTNGNPNILEEPPFAEKKEPKVDYNKIFADPLAEAKKQKGKTPNKQDSKKENTSPNVASKSVGKKKSEGSSNQQQRTQKITHPRFRKGGSSDHEVRILASASSPYVFNADDGGGGQDFDGIHTLEKPPPSPLYRCPVCEFAASRVNVVVLHSKSHSSTKVSYAVNSEATPKRIPSETATVKNKETKSTTKKIEKSNKQFTESPSSTTTASKKGKSLAGTPAGTLAKKGKSFLDSAGAGPGAGTGATAGAGGAKKRPVSTTKPDKKSQAPTQPKKPRMSKKEKEEKVRRLEEKQQLMMEWSEDEDEEAEEFKKIQESINQSLRVEFSDDEEVDDVFKRDQHHFHIHSDDEEPFTHRNKLDFNRSGSRSSLATPDSLRLNSSTTSDKHSPSPLPNKEASRSSQPSPASSLKSAGALSSSQSPSPSPTKNSSSKVGGKDSPSSPFSKLVASTKNDTVKKEDGLCQREKTVQDLFNIDKALEETKVPEVPSLTFTKFSDFSAFKKKQKLLSKTMSPNKEDENQNTADSLPGPGPVKEVVDDFDFDNNEDDLFMSPLKKMKRTVSPKPVPKSEPSSESPSKFSSLSAKAKAKQLARQAAMQKTKPESPSPPAEPKQSNSSSDINNTSSDKCGTPSSEDSEFSPASNSSTTNVAQKSLNQAAAPKLPTLSPVKDSISIPSQRSPEKASPFKAISTPPPSSHKNGTLVAKSIIGEHSKTPITPFTAAALAVTTFGQLSPAPVMGITQLSSPSTIAAITVGGGAHGPAVPPVTPGGGVAAAANVFAAAEGGSLEGGSDDQIYYMLVDDGAQLENQTILIDEAQLAVAGGQPGNVIIQGDGEILVEGGTRTVLLQDATSGQLVNVVVADDKDISNPVSVADTSGGVAILPNHPSSSMHSQVPLITTASGKTPIMISNTQTEEKN